jgi:hypothetical protein
VARIIHFLNYFLIEKLHGPDPQLVDHGGAGPRWTLDRGMAMTSPELGQTAAPGHGGSPTMAQQRERSTGSPSRASPGRGWQRGDRATAVKKWRWRRSVRAALGHGEKRTRAGRGAAKTGGTSPFYRGLEGGQRCQDFMADVNAST